MTKEEKKEISKLSKQFAAGFKSTFGSINGTGWLIVDPLSGWLNSIGFKNTPHQMPENEKHCQVLLLEFSDGSKFIPAGADLKPLNEKFKNWMWL